MLDAVQELRDAGAEAIQIGDVRVVADTWFADTDDGHRGRGHRGAPALRHHGHRRRATPWPAAMEIPGGVTGHRAPARGGDTDDQIEDEVAIDALLTLDRASVRSPRTHRHPLSGCAPHDPNPRSDMSDLEYPAGPALHRRARVGARATATSVRVGITSFAQEALGDVVYVSLPAVGDAVVAGDTCGEVESTKSVSDLYAPVSGEVTAVNAALDATPELVNSDPYGEGWMYELRAADAGGARRPAGRRALHARQLS